MLQETWMALLIPNKGMNYKSCLPYQVTFCLSKLLSGLLRISTSRSGDRMFILDCPYLTRKPMEGDENKYTIHKKLFKILII